MDKPDVNSILRFQTHSNFTDLKYYISYSFNLHEVFQVVIQIINQQAPLQRIGPQYDCQDQYRLTYDDDLFAHTIEYITHKLLVTLLSPPFIAH